MTPMTVGYRVERRGPDGFEAAWTELGGTCERVPSAVLVPAIERWRGQSSAVAGPQPAFDGLAGVERWPDCGIGTMAAATSAIVYATAAIAQTGTVVVDAAANEGRALSLLAPRTLFVVDASAIVDTPGGLLRDRRRWWPNALPSQIVLITGPSRSADIEMTLTIGVHGPGDVHAVVVVDR